MSPKPFFRGVRWALVTACIASLCLSIVPSQDAAAQSGGGRLYLPYLDMVNGGGETASSVVSSLSVSVEDQKAAQKFWTHEAIAAARPLVVEMQMGPVTQDDAALAAEDEATAVPGRSPAGASAPDADRIAQGAYPEDWQQMATSAETPDAGPDAVDGTSQVYDHYIVNANTNLWKLYPHIWVGRLSFKTSSGTAYCSATSISNNVMLTAAHCLYDTTNNKWYSSWVFSPAYRNGSAPYGSFAATNCWVLTSYANLTGGYNINTWSRYDVGVCKTGKNSAGVTLNSAVGYMGRQWDGPYARLLHVLGYPFTDYNLASVANAGRYMHTCVAESFQRAKDVLGAGCNLGQGMSGGPWMAGYAPGAVVGGVYGVSSGIISGSQNVYSARFTSNNIVPLCKAAGC